ncbi:aldehyde dehydrogenase family protein, partial [Vibrio parahaemolyticus V-223/04]
SLSSKMKRKHWKLRTTRSMA